LRSSLSKKRTEILHGLARRINNPIGRSVPAFLVGCGRSGTSMMVQQLGKTWQIEVYNENHPAAFERWFLRDDAAIRSLTSQSLAPVVLFKPILETFRSSQFPLAFPGAKLLFAFRHFDDVINSSIRKFGPADRIGHVRDWMSNDFRDYAAAPPPAASREAIRSLWNPDFGPLEGAALFWLFTNRLYFDLGLDRRPDAHLIQYEDYTLHPEENLKAICDFLGIDYAETMLSGIRRNFIQRDPAPSFDPAVRQACEDLWDRLVAAAVPSETAV
jgi:hypothetical protein